MATQKELPGFSRYGRDFRTQRFQRVLTQQLLLENEQLDVETSYGLTYMEAQRFIGYAIVSLFRGILREGGTTEKKDAVEAVRMLSYFLHPADSSARILQFPPPREDQRSA